jgi:hypothetical protein
MMTTHSLAANMSKGLYWATMTATGNTTPSLAAKQVDSVLGNDDSQCHPLPHCKCVSFCSGKQQQQQQQPTPSPSPPLTCKHEIGVFLSYLSSGWPPHHQHHPLSLTNTRVGVFLCLLTLGWPPHHWNHPSHTQM